MSYPWYDKINDSSLNQGDLIERCPIIVPPSGIIQPGDSISITASIYNVIVMSQSCDLVNGKIRYVLVCNYMRFSEFIRNLDSKERTPNNMKANFKKLKDGAFPNYHLLNKSIENGIDDYLIVEFKNTFSIHIDTLKEHILSLIQNAPAQRARLCPPYREQLSQSFAKFFMRVGLPQNIPDPDPVAYSHLYTNQGK